MPNVLTITVADPTAAELLNAGAYEPGAVIRVHSSDSATGTFTVIAGSGSTPAIPLVAGTSEYTGYDPAGTTTTWYRIRYENAGATRVSDWADPFRIAATAPALPSPGHTGHTYASLDQMKRYIRDAGADIDGGIGTVNDELMLTFLEDASRTIDEWCQRTTGRKASGFGPRIGTNRYNGTGTDLLRLHDDLLSIASVTVLDSTGGASSTYTVETDFYREPYDEPPYRALRCNGLTGKSTWSTGLRTVSVVGTWGYSSETVLSGTTINEALDTSETGVDAHDGTLFSPGMTIVIDSEQMYVTPSTSAILTVVRAANGTTAAIHSDEAPISIVRYPRPVAATCIRLALRRWKQRDAGVTGGFGGGDVPVAAHLDSEKSILDRGLWQYRLVHTV